MPQIQTLTSDRPGANRQRTVRRDENVEMSVDDTPPLEFRAERYAAWSATSFSSFVPFSAPTER